MLVIKKGVVFDFDLKKENEIFYLLEPNDEDSFRNIIEPIIYNFTSRILNSLSHLTD